MIQKIKKYMKKYNNPKLWIEEMRVREEKKQGVQQVVVPHVSMEMQPNVLIQQEKTIFRKSEKLYNQEEANMLRKIYDELEDFVKISRLAIG